MNNDKKSKSAVTTMKNFEFYLLFAAVGGIMALTGASVGFSYSHGFSTTELLPFPVEKKEDVPYPVPLLVALPVPSPVPSEEWAPEAIFELLETEEYKRTDCSYGQILGVFGSEMYKVEKELSSCNTAAAGTYFARAKALAKCEESICPKNGWVRGAMYDESARQGL